MLWRSQMKDGFLIERALDEARSRHFRPIGCIASAFDAGSTGRRNTGVKFLCRGFKSQGLAWPLIELAGHFVEMGLRVHRQVGSFRKILSQQAIGVLVVTALPWTLRIAKVNIDVDR